MKKRLCIIGLDREVASKIKANYFGGVISHDVVPRYFVDKGVLYVEKSNGVGMLPVDKVIFHGIFENDFDLITALALWGGECFPNALAMMNCRLKLPCLVRAMRITKFNSARGMVSPETMISVDDLSVAKWGNWHCGENKEKIETSWTSGEAAIIEPFFAGDAVRVVAIGNQYLQIKLEGEDWLKSIHDDRACVMDIDPELLDDTLQIKDTFGMEMIAVDYIVGKNGEKHLLEVNHIPNMTRFLELQNMYLEEVFEWMKELTII